MRKPINIAIAFDMRNGTVQIAKDAGWWRPVRNRQLRTLCTLIQEILSSDRSALGSPKV